MMSMNNVKGMVKMQNMGGGGEMQNIQSFLALVILGYFGIKIVFGGFFGFYPDKYYYRSVDIQTNEGSDDMTNTKKIALNAFMPGIWNNEMTDFVSCIILTGLVYVFTNISSRQMFGAGGLVAPALTIGYIIGLTFPTFYTSMKWNCHVDLKDKCTQHNWVIGILGAIIILALTVVNASYPTENKSSYFIYLTAIVLLLMGLFFTRKFSKTYQQVSYYKNTEDKCTYKNTGYIFSSGDEVLITPAFMSWVLLFFFVIEPQSDGMKQFVYFLFGFLLGIFVSSMSYYGIDYFLIKVGEKTCNSVDECYLKDMPRPPADTQTSDTSVDIEEISGQEVMVKPNKQMTAIKTVMITMIILMFVFFIYMSMRKK
jgi:hypothetical protein